MSSSILLPMLLAFGIGYLLGSIPFGLLLTRAAGFGDVRKIGSGNIGATNVLRTGNKKLAAATLLLDGLKGTVAVGLAIWAVGRFGIGETPLVGAELPRRLAEAVHLLTAAPWMAALGAVVGHVYPAWLGFRGGKGVATYIGVLLAAHWQAALVFAAVWLVTAAITRLSSLSAMVALACVVAFVALKPHPVPLMATVLMTLLIVWKHRENIQRLIAGTESRIGAKATPEAGPG